MLYNTALFTTAVCDSHAALLFKCDFARLRSLKCAVTSKDAKRTECCIIRTHFTILAPHHCTHARRRRETFTQKEKSFKRSSVIISWHLWLIFHSHSLLSHFLCYAHNTPYKSPLDFAIYIINLARATL